MTIVGGKEIVLRPIGRWTDRAKVLLGLVAIVAPDLLNSGWPVVEFEDVAGLVLAASGVWGMLRPRSRAPQWLAIAASAALVVWPAGAQPATLVAPWIGIIAGVLGALTAIVRLRQIPRTGGKTS